MEDYRLDQSGQEVQDILNGAAMQSDLTAETERATEAEQTLQDNIDAEATRAQGAEGTLQDNIDAEEARAKAAEKQNADDIDAIEEKIPSGASSSNKLATVEYVADVVATATATFRGTYNLVSDLHLAVNATEQQIATALAGAISTADNNDYCFILVPTSSETPTEIKEIDRYKFNGTAWAFEYKLNNSGFNAAQWAAINSGITSGDVAKLAALPTNAQLTTLLAGLQSDIDGEEARAKGVEGTLQDNIDAEKTRAKAAEKQIADDIDAIEAVLPENASSENKVATESEINSLSAAIEAILLLIPSAATSLNKLADKAFVNSSIATATATFRGTYNLVDDLGLTTSATHAQIATALGGAILTSNNNDYAFVQIPTSTAMPTEIAKTERYKFNGTAWEYEYDLNNSGFTADQWAAINSGITQALVTKLSALPTNAELTTELGTLTSGITAINQKIPNAASQANKLVDTAAMESYIVEVLNVLTISYNVTSTDGHVTFHIEQVDGKITSVTLATSDIASAAALNLKASQSDLTALEGRVTTAEGNITTLNGNLTSLTGRVSTNETDIAQLQAAYEALTQSDIIIGALPSSGVANKIYRVPGTSSYSDYMWNGSTWVLMATYNNAIDDEPTPGSNNLVKSGGVAGSIVYDISAANAVGGTIATYADLAAALGTNGANVPASIRKGGMSIKFVQTDDNKYVKFFCMAQNFTTDVTQWQGEDSEIFAESDNFANIGLIAEYCKKIQSQRATGIFVKGYYITTNVSVIDNTPVANSNYCYSIIEVEDGDICCIKGQGGGDPRLYAVTDSNLNVLKLADASPVVEEKEITIDVGGKYLFVNSLINVEHFAYIKRREVQQTSGNSKIDLMSQDAITNFVYAMQGAMVNFRFVNGKRIVNNTAPVSGIMVDNSAYCCATIDVTEDETYNIKGRGGSTSRLYSIVDNEGNILDIADLNTTSGILIELNVTIPANAVKMYVNSEINFEHHLYKKYPVARQGFGNSKIDYISQRASSDLIQFNSGNKRIFEYIDDYFVNVSGTTIPTSPTHNTSYSYAKSKVLPGERIVVRGQGGGGPRLYAISDKNDNIIMVAGTAINTSVSTQEIVVPMNGAWIYVNSLKAVEHYAYAEAQNDRLIKTDFTVVVAASNSSDFDKISADYVCTGTNDEEIINKAIESIPLGGKVVLRSGDYYVDSFSKSSANKPCAILINATTSPRYVQIEGQRGTFPLKSGSSRIIVSDTCYSGISAQSIVIGCESSIVDSWFKNGFSLKDIQIELPNCTKPVIGVSCLHSVYCDIEGVICYNRETKDAWINATQAPTPDPNSVGFYGINANNSWYYMRFWECLSMGFGTGFKIGGDHITMINCATAKNNYGYTFGTESNITCSHHITLINCCSESDANYMYFGQYAVSAKEPIVISNFQIEYDSNTAPAVTHKLAEEETPGIFCGNITYSSMPNSKFFENGSGINFKVSNLRSLLRGTTANRPSYSNPLEMYFDETLGKPIWNTENGWVDATGASV